MKISINPKIFKTSENTCDAIPAIYGTGSVVFTADVPKGVLVTGVFVDGKNIENYRFDEYRHNGIKCETMYPRGEDFEGRTIVAVFVDETCSGELYNLAFSGSVNEIVVECVETMCCCRR
jgi:hypothetical protein